MAIESKEIIDGWLDDNIKSDLNPPITGDEVNQAFKKITESFFNKTDNAEDVGLREYDSNKSYSSGDVIIYQSQIYLANKVTTGTFNTSDWDTLTINAVNVATKDDLASLSAGLKPKTPVRIATESNIDLTTGGLLTLDGVTLSDGDRVLVKDQINKVENGIYVASSSSWSRSDDADDNPNNEIERGTFLFVQEGTEYAGYGFFVSNSGTGDLVVGTHGIQFSVMGRLTPDLGNYATVTQLNNLDLEAVLANGYTTTNAITINSSGDFSDININSAYDLFLTAASQLYLYASEIHANNVINYQSDQSGSFADQSLINKSFMESKASEIAQAFDSLQDAALKAENRDAGKTASVVMMEPDEGVFLTSLADNNTIEVNDTYVTTLNKGDRLDSVAINTLSGISVVKGTKIVSKKGHTGVMGAALSTVHPLNYEAYAAKQFYVFVFRAANPTNYSEINVATGAVPSVVTVSGPAGTLVQDIPSFSFHTFQITALGEYSINATQPVFATTSSNKGEYDHRIIPPLSTYLIGHLRNSRVSALYPNTQVEVFTRLGNTETVTVNPGAPVSLFDILTDEASKTHYDPDGYCMLKANGPISCFSGADGAGLEATPYISVDSLPFIVGIPLGIIGTVHSRNISFASPYTGQVKIYDSTGTLVDTGSLTRGGAINTPATSVTDQQFPAGYRYIPTNSTILANGGYAEADVPIYVVANFYESGKYDHEETVLTGINLETPRLFKRNPTTGLVIGESFDALNNQTWATV